jgi:23S rRNA pseudouridine955/2504/2580 synthase
VNKYYLTVVKGNLRDELVLRDRMVKDSETNTVKVTDADTGDGKLMETIARPLAHAKGYTLVEVQLVTGRTHQIRAHLGKAGYPVAGDAKYGNRRVNESIAAAYGLSTQFLHAYKLEFTGACEPLEHLAGLTVTAPLPPQFAELAKGIFGEKTAAPYTDTEVNRREK